MAKGKSKQVKKGKGRKQEKHAFVKKEWYRVMSPPAINGCHVIGWTPGNKTIGKKLSKDNVLGRVCEVSFADIHENSDQYWRKLRMQVEDVEGSNLYTSFYGLDITRDKIGGVLKKRQTIIDIWTEVKTSDGYILRVFVKICTNRQKSQQKKNAYAKSSQCRLIRKKVSKRLKEIAERCSVTKFANEILSRDISNKITSSAAKVYPIKIALITKVKVLKKPKIDVKSLAKASKDAKVKTERTIRKITPADEVEQEQEEDETPEVPEE